MTTRRIGDTLAVEVVARNEHQDLVERLRRGDPHAADELYRLYGGVVWQILLRLLGPDPDLEDVHHEVFLQAIRSASRFEGSSSLRTWLRGIAVNCTRNLLRGRRRGRWLSFLDPHTITPPVIEIDHDRGAELRAVHAVVAKLPPDERITFLLRYLERCTVPEIAEACGVSTGTVGRRLRRGRARFRELARRHPELQAYLDEDADGTV
ncbi:MAG: sigma-70 family RNA polymerase sigma factor [Myxococcales bacterium]|nr:sigma-70 family RNA polymerase sigma factor [Myxococcales bacterium]